MDPFNLDYCIHAANILLLAAYSVRDMLWLRLFAVASSVIACRSGLRSAGVCRLPESIFSKPRDFLSNRPLLFARHVHRRVAALDQPAAPVRLEVARSLDPARPWFLLAPGPS